jgi:uncharacterized delta-60 repeat protein
LGTGGFVVVRYLPNGSLDNSFSTDGTVVTAVGSSYDDAYSIVLQSDGKIVVAGDSNTDIAVVRYNSDGSLDNSFDTDGKVLTDITVGDSDYGYSLALQSDGKIVVAGSSYNGTNSDFAVVRYNNTSPSGIEESVNGQLVTRIYPNPFFSQTTIQTDPLLKNATLTVYNLHGQEVKQIKNLSGQTITLNRDNLPKGLYFIQLTQDNKILSADKLVIND